MNRKQWMLVGLVAVAVALLSGAVLAQGWAGCPWLAGGPNAETLQKQFGLTSDEAQKVVDLQKKAADRLSKLRTEMVTQQQEWLTLWRADKLDEKAIRAKFRELQRIRAELQEAQLDLQLELRKVLPADKWARIAPPAGAGLGRAWGGSGLGLGPGWGRGPAGQRGMGRGMGWGPRDGTGPRGGTPFCPWYPFSQ